MRKLRETNAWHRTAGRSTRHLGWIFSGPAEFEARSSTFFAEGFGRGERLMYVADDPNMDQWPKDVVDRGDLVVLGTSEVYGPERMVDAAAQRAAFERALAEALREGYTGLRVAADNTSLITESERLSAWLEWEAEGELFMAENPVTGLCAFDRARADGDAIEAVLGAHRATLPPVP